MKIFVIVEGGGLANMMFFPPNSKIIIILNGGWVDIANKQQSESWWIAWNKQHYGYLNHTIYIYDKVTCLKKNSSHIITKINDINDFYNFVKNI